MTSKSTPFVRLEAFAVKPSRLTKRKTWSVKQVLGELVRRPGCHPHVRKPASPVIVAGTTEGLYEVLSAAPADRRKEGHRSDTPVLLSSVPSNPDRWDKCDPNRLLGWIRDEVRYHDLLFPARIGVVVLHIDESHPHLHILVHESGRSIKPLHPGFRAGDEAYKRVREAGLGRMAANRIRGDAEAMAMKAFLDHHHQAIGAPRGWDRDTGQPRERTSRHAALQSQQIRDQADPVDSARAEMNKAAIKALVLANPIALSPIRPEVPPNPLDAIGFQPQGNLASTATIGVGVAPDVAPQRNDTYRELQAILAKVLDTTNDFIEFTEKCRAEGILLLPRMDGDRITGISYGYRSRTVSGSALGRRFAWPRLSEALGYDQRSPRHRSAIKHAALCTGAALGQQQCILEPIDPGRPEAEFPEVPASTLTRGPKASIIVSASEATRTFAWRKSGRAAIFETASRIQVIKPVADVLRLALKLAVQKGWRAIRILGPKALFESIRRAISRIVSKRRIRVELVAGDIRRDIPSNTPPTKRPLRPTPSTPALAPRAGGAGVQAPASKPAPPLARRSEGQLRSAPDASAAIIAQARDEHEESQASPDGIDGPSGGQLASRRGKVRP